ncbi:glycosyltransferase [bacterium]|nr:glycosyltransferase [bacterium]
MHKEKSLKQELPQSDLKLAVVFDPLYKRGGAEKHLKYILQTFPNAELFVPYYDKEFVKKYFPNVKIHSSFMQYLPWKDRLKYLYLLLQPLAFKSLNLRNFDGVLSLSIAFAKFAKAPRGKKHVNYCMSPPKFLWQKNDRSLKKEDQLEGVNKMLFNFYSFFMDTFLEDIWKSWDIKAAQRVDHMIANSKVVKRRIKKYYDVNADVMYPPVEVEDMRPERIMNKKEHWFLYVGRIETYKGVELAIRACIEAKVPLKIIGKGDDEQRMKDLVKELNAKGLVKFLGFISDTKKAKMMQRCKALIFPVRGEDFGIVPVEANAAGSAVIAYRSGGVVETISSSNPKTGIFFRKYKVEELAKILKNFKEEEYDSRNCINHAQEFTASIFMYKLKNYIEDVIQNK